MAGEGERWQVRGGRWQVRGEARQVRGARWQERKQETGDLEGHEARP